MPTLLHIHPQLSNTELTKQPGLLMQTFHDLYGYDSVIACYAEGAYPDLEYVPDVKLDKIVRTGSGQRVDVFRYIETHTAPDMLYLQGISDVTFAALNTMKRKNPHTATLLKLDANIWWMNQLDLTEEMIALLQGCTVIGVESWTLYEYLNRKWPLAIDYVPHGYADFGKVAEPTYQEKRNVILTVGRIGNWQKGHGILLDAFAQVAPYMPDWELRLVGTMEDRFKKTWERYFRDHPELYSRVHWLGFIRDKAILAKQYREAKVFCLSSRFEGGAPNVLNQALRFGCYPIITAIDCAVEGTGGGRFGDTVPIDDVDALAARLFARTQEEQVLQESFSDITAYAKDSLDLRTIVPRIHYLLQLNQPKRGRG